MEITDADVAATKVSEYLELLKQGNAAVRALNSRRVSYLDDPTFQAISAAVNSRIGLIEKIASSVDPVLGVSLRSARGITWNHSGELPVVEELPKPHCSYASAARLLAKCDASHISVGAVVAWRQGSCFLRCGYTFKKKAPDADALVGLATPPDRLPAAEPPSRYWVS